MQPQGEANALGTVTTSGSTVYNKEQMTVTYTSGAKNGQTATFAHVSFDGNTWYWVDQRALNLDIAATYPAVNNEGKALPPLDGLALGSTTVFGGIPTLSSINSQLIDNAFNANGQVVYYPEDASLSATDRQTFEANLKAAAGSWNTALGQTVFVPASSASDASITLKVGISSSGSGSASASGATGIDASLIQYGSNVTDTKNVLFITMRHELGHDLGLNHTGGAQYMGMPDDYSFNDVSDVM